MRELRPIVGNLTQNYEKWILCHFDLDHQPKVTNFNRVRASAISIRLTKTALKSVHTHTETNCSDIITRPRFRGGVIIAFLGIRTYTSTNNLD